MPTATLERTARADPLARGHAHNSYEHCASPVMDSLARRLGSVETDVWLHRNQTLQVDHFIDDDVPPVGSLHSIYLEQLRRWVDAHDGVVDPDRSAPLQLLIDLKTAPRGKGANRFTRQYSSDSAEIWETLEHQLAVYDQYLTTYDAGTVVPGAVTVVITGDVPLDRMRRAGFRRSFANLTKPDPSVPVDLAPLLNGRYDTVDEHGKARMRTAREIREFTDTAHREGRRARFWWNKPLGKDPSPARTRQMWQTLWDAGVDHISGDNVDDLAAFLRSKGSEKARH